MSVDEVRDDGWPVLSGTDARQLIRSLGWHVVAPDTLKAKGRTMRASRARVTRLVCTTAVLKSVTDLAAGQVGPTRILVVAGGYASARPSGARPMLLSEGDVVVVPEGTDLTIGVAERLELFEYVLAPDRLAGIGDASPSPGQASRVGGRAFAEFVGAALECLSDEEGTASSGFAWQLLDTAASELLAGVLVPSNVPEARGEEGATWT